MKHQRTTHKPPISQAALRAFARTTLSVGLLSHAVICLATLAPYKPPTLEEKIKRAEVIVIATVGETRYYKWKDLSRAELPEISKIQLDGFDAYVNLADLQILYDKYADIPIGRNPLKINMPLWSQRYGCFAEYGEKEPEPFPNGKKFIFFIGSPSRTSKGTLLETICQHNSAAMDQLSTVHQYIRNIESRTK